MNRRRFLNYCSGVITPLMIPFIPPLYKNHGIIYPKIPIVDVHVHLIGSSPLNGCYVSKRFQKSLAVRLSRLFLDLGSVPGSWSQVASKKIKNGKILSVDIKEMLPVSNTIFSKGDFTEWETQNKIMKFFNTKIDTVVSDMASNTTGNKELDSLRTGNLCLNALEFSRKILKTDAYFISKVFMGAIFKEIQIRAKEIFKEVLIFKPKSSRKESKEIYIFSKNLKGIND